MDMGHCHLYTKKHFTVHYNPYFSLGLQMLISGICLTVFTNLVGLVHYKNGSVIQYAIPISEDTLAILGRYCLPGCVWLPCWPLFVTHARILPTEQTSIYAYINPVVAVICGWRMLRKDYPLYRH